MKLTPVRYDPGKASHKLTDKQREALRADIACGEYTPKQLAVRYRVTTLTIGRMRRQMTAGSAE